MLRPLFPVEEVAEAGAGRMPLSDDPRRGLTWPIAVLFSNLAEQPAIVVEMAFYPAHDLPEPLAPESWANFRDRLGLPPFAGPASLRAAPDGLWHIDFGPHTVLSNMARSYQMFLPRPDSEWEETVHARGSCLLVFGTDLGSDDETGAVAIPVTAAAVCAAYAGSRSVPELSEIPGLFVVPVNRLRPYDPIRPVTFVLDTDVLIQIQRFCFAPAKLGAKLEAVRHLLVNLSGRDVFPGPALAQLYQPSRTRTEARRALDARAAFALVMSLGRAKLMEADRVPATVDAAYDGDVAGLTSVPQMLVMYAGVLRLRQLWDPTQKLKERAQSFESFMHWLRDELRLNAAILVQVAFNLWIADEPAQQQASRLLHFRAEPVTDRSLRGLWGTAYDIFLIAAQPEAMEVPDVADVVILTFDRGLAGMRDFFEHVDELQEADGTADLDSSRVGKARMKMNFHPALDHMKARVAHLAGELHTEMFARIAGPDTAASPEADLLALIEREEQLLLGGRE